MGGYAEAFRRAFLGEPVSDGPWVATPVGLAAVAVYLRFRSENSNPRSLDQQLRLTLERARLEGQFVPWGCVYADSGVSGTTAGRIGYRLAKAAMLDRAGPGTLHIDDHVPAQPGHGRVDQVLPGPERPWQAGRRGERRVRHRGRTVQGDPRRLGCPTPGKCRSPPKWGPVILTIDADDLADAIAGDYPAIGRETGHAGGFEPLPSP